MHIGRTTLLVLAVAVLPGGVMLLIPTIYRRSIEAARELTARIQVFRGVMQPPARSTRDKEAKSPLNLPLNLLGSTGQVSPDGRQLEAAVSPH